MASYTKEKSTLLLEDIRSCIANNEDWHEVKATVDIKLWKKKSKHFAGHIFKGVTTMNASPEKCFEIFYPKPQSTRSKWDPALKDMEMVKYLQEQTDQDPEVYILRSMARGAMMGLISERDFVDLLSNFNNDEFVGTIGESVETQLCPPAQGYVRGHNYPCGILAYRIPEEPNKSRLYYIAQADAGGNLPMKLVESAVPNAIMDFYKQLSKQISLPTQK